MPSEITTPSIIHSPVIGDTNDTLLPTSSLTSLKLTTGSNDVSTYTTSVKLV